MKSDWINSKGKITLKTCIAKRDIKTGEYGHTPVTLPRKYWKLKIGHKKLDKTLQIYSPHLLSHYLISQFTHTTRSPHLLSHYSLSPLTLPLLVLPTYSPTTHSPHYWFSQLTLPHSLSSLTLPLITPTTHSPHIPSATYSPSLTLPTSFPSIFLIRSFALVSISVQNTSDRTRLWLILVNVA